MSPDLLEGALIAAGAFLAGQWLPRPHRKHVRAPKPVQAMCGCKHHHSYHDPKMGECHGRVYVGMGAYEDCTCKQYSGPVPLPEVYAPEIAS
jgi:hypothetical protein